MSSLENYLEWVQQAFPEWRDEVAIVRDGDSWELTLKVQQRHLRPGETVSGPTLMMMADTCAYLAVLHAGGQEMASAVTSQLNFSFLRRPTGKLLWARAEKLKVGRRLAVFNIYLGMDQILEPVAHATATYALPG